MRIYVPRAIHMVDWGSYVDSYWRGPNTESPPYRYHITNGVCLPGHTILSEDYSYFWDTHDRPMNDCVHSKIVDSEDVTTIPNGILLTGGRDCIFSPKWYAYGECAYAGPEMKYSDTTFIPTMLCVNDKEAAYTVWITPLWRTTGYTTFQICVEFYYAAVDQRDYPTVPYIKVYCQLEFRTDRSETIPNWYSSYLTSVSSPLRVTSWYGGNSTVRDFVFSLLKEMEPIFVSSFLGLTKYGRSGSEFYFVPSNSDSFKKICDTVYNKLSVLPAYGRKTKWKDWKFYTFKEQELFYPEPVHPKDRFLFHEDDRIQEGLAPFLLDNSGLQNYWWNVLVQQAYLDTLDSVPKLNDNSISNIIEIAGFIKSLVIDHKIDLPKSLGDIWLSYRYQYATTKLDAEEAISFMHRHRELGTLDQWIHCFGASHIDFSNNDFNTRVTCRCGLEIRPSDVALLGKVWRALYTYGLQPNFYVIWDMIPYSFIIDWLIPVGNLMHALDADSMYNGTYYEIKDIVFSISYDIVDKYANRYHQYTRWVQNDIPQLNGFYFFEEDPVTTKVKGMRILDTLSLFIGRRK